ncbi:MAG TPA: zf-HC2 domain-containing protein [bacterium]|nr:zf-HC2 domain-containing protein [bacterium]
MDCRQVHQAYSVYIQGKLSPQQTAWVTEHIQDCPDCYLLDQNVRNAFVIEKTGMALAASGPSSDKSSSFQTGPADRDTWLI